MIPFDHWDQDLDAYFVLTHRGIRSGLRNFRIPFSNSLFETLVPQVGQAALQSEPLTGLAPEEIPKWLHQLAVGLSVQPDRGIAVRSRISLSPQIDLADMFSENPGGRELALNHLPDAPFLLALGGPISATQSKWITALPGQLVPPQNELDLRISRVQAALLAPPPVPKDANDPGQHNFDDVAARLQSCLIVVVTVEDSQSALDQLEPLFKALVDVASTERGELEGIPVLRVGLMVQERKLELCIATPGRETLVFAAGGNVQLARALAPFHGDANLSGSETVHAAVRLLPESTSWLVALDLKKVFDELLQGFEAEDKIGQFINQLLRFDEEDTLPVALGVSWQQSDLEVHLSLPEELLPLARRVAPLLPFLPFLPLFFPQLGVGGH